MTDEELVISTLKDKIIPNLQRIVENPDLSVKNNDQAFGYWIVDNLLEEYIDPSAADIGIPGHEHGIDIVDINEEEKQIPIVQNKWSDEIKHQVKTADISRLSSAPKILYEQMDGNEEFKEVSEDFKKQIESSVDYKIKLVFVVAGEFTSDQLDEIKIQPKDVQIGARKFNVDYQAIDRKIIYNRLVHPKTEEITLEYEKSMEFLHGSRETGFFIVKGKEFNLKLKKEQHMALFELNPRYFLEVAKKSINSGIVKTAKDDNEATKFLEFNNGITCLCDDLKIEKVKGNWEENNGKKEFIEDENGNDIREKLIIENLKIVNGCQTILSLGKCKDKVSENVRVLFKLYKIEEADTDLKKQIYTYTNSQNKLSERDLASDQQEQINLQQSIGATEAGFFWKLKSGEHLFHESDIHWKQKHSPKDLRIIDNFRCAKYVHACYGQDPYEAGMLKIKDLFDKDEDIFKKIWRFDPQKFMFAQILEYCRKKTFTALKKDAIKDQSEKTWKDTFDHTENIAYLENNYFKNGCIAIFIHHIEKQSNSKEIKEAIMKLFHHKAIKDGKVLSEKNRKKTIIPAFAYFILKLDNAVTDKVLDSVQAKDVPKEDKIQPKFENKDVYTKLKNKVQNTIDTATEKGIYEKLFQAIIDQADDLDADPFPNGFSFKI